MSDTRAHARCRLSPGDLMRQLSDDALRLATQLDTPARGHSVVEARIAEAERIAIEVRRVVRG